VLHAASEGITASCPPGSLQGWTGYFVGYFDVMPPVYWRFLTLLERLRDG